MAVVRCIMEMGMGVDVHGRDYTNGAKRAVFDALHHSSLGFQRLNGKLPLIYISEPTRRYANSYAVFCLKKKKMSLINIYEPKRLGLITYAVLSLKKINVTKA